MQKLALLASAVLMCGCAQQKNYGVSDDVWAILTDEQKQQLAKQHDVEQNQAVENATKVQKQELKKDPSDNLYAKPHQPLKPAFTYTIDFKQTKEEREERNKR